MILVIAFPRATVRRIGLGYYLGLVGGLLIDLVLFAVCIGLIVFCAYVIIEITRTTLNAGKLP